VLPGTGDGNQTWAVAPPFPDCLTTTKRMQNGDHDNDEGLWLRKAADNLA